MEKRGGGADTYGMGRAGFFVAIIGAVIGLCLMAWRLSAVVEAREAVGAPAGGATTVGLVSGDPVEQASRVAATARVQQAMIVAESYAAENGTYAGISTETLHVLDTTLDATVVVAFANDSGYCVQAGSGTAVVHSTGPAQPPADGPCA
ncbi:MAG: hypothetical protein U0R69_06595 [Gaiellales bacterium]